MDTLLSAADAAIEAALLSLGLTRVLSYQVADALQDGRLVRVLVGVLPAGRWVPRADALALGLPTPIRRWLEAGPPA